MISRIGPLLYRSYHSLPEVQALKRSFRELVEQKKRIEQAPTNIKKIYLASSPTNALLQDTTRVLNSVYKIIGQENHRGEISPQLSNDYRTVCEMRQALEKYTMEEKHALWELNNCHNIRGG